MILALFLAAALSDTKPPPPRYDSGEYTAATIYVANPNYYCQQLNGEIRSWQPTVVIACYAPSIDTVIMPYYCNPKRYKPSPFCKDLYRHELGHARGGMHLDGQWVDGYWVK